MTVRYDWGDIADWARRHVAARYSERDERDNAERKRRYEIELAEWRARPWWRRRKCDMPRAFEPHYTAFSWSGHHSRPMLPGDIGCWPLDWVESREMAYGDL